MGNVGSLVPNEVDLARVEVTASVSKAGGALGSMAFAFLLAITGLNLLAATVLPLAIWAGVPPRWAAAVVGIALLAIAYVLNQIGFVPTRAARSVQREATRPDDGNNQ